MVNKLVTLDGARKNMNTHEIHLLREIRRAPRQPMFEPILLSGEPKKNG